MTDIERRGTPIAAEDVQAGDIVEGIDPSGCLVCGLVEGYNGIVDEPSLGLVQLVNYRDLTLVRRPLAVGQWWGDSNGKPWECIGFSESRLSGYFRGATDGDACLIDSAYVEANWTPMHKAPMPSLEEQAATADQRRLNRAARAAGLEASEPPPLDECSKCGHRMGWHNADEGCCWVDDWDDATGCECLVGAMAPEPAEPECPFPMGAKVRHRSSHDQFIVSGWEQYHCIDGVKWCVEMENGRHYQPQYLELVPLPVHCESCGQVIP